MMRLRITIVAALTGLALGLVGVPAASAAGAGNSDSGGLYTLPVNGVAKNGKKFKGTYTIERFVAKGGQAYSVGTLKGRLKNRRVKRENVKMPAALQPGETGLGVRGAQAVCPVLNLVIGPIDLNLLGLRVQLGGPGPGGQLNQPIVLRITAIEGGGLLGDLLCGLTGALNTPGALDQLNQNLQQLTATLNALVSLLGGLPATQP
jgi:hypothetical protein